MNKLQLGGVLLSKNDSFGETFHNSKNLISFFFFSPAFIRSKILDPDILYLILLELFMNLVTSDGRILYQTS